MIVSYSDLQQYNNDTFLLLLNIHYIKIVCLFLTLNDMPCLIIGNIYITCDATHYNIYIFIYSGILLIITSGTLSQ